MWDRTEQKPTSFRARLVSSHPFQAFKHFWCYCGVVVWAFVASETVSVELEVIAQLLLRNSSLEFCSFFAGGRRRVRVQAVLVMVERNLVG